MIPRIILLQSSTSVHDIARSLSEHACELCCYSSLEELVPNLHDTSCSIGIVVFDDSSMFPVGRLTKLTAGLCMEWIAVVPPKGTHDPSMARTLSTFFFDYHTLPIDRTRLLYSIGHAHGKAMLRRIARQPGGSFEKRYGMIGKSPRMLALYSELEKVMRARAPVFISGESGVGKELAARAVHMGSVRRQGQFIPVNCGAMPEPLVESLLFGHERGAFTGANERSIGSIEAASGGTIFLDEIGDLPRSAQASLLRFLQESTVTRVGSTREIHIDARIIAATHMDLRKAGQAGRFREDLFYRLNVLNVAVPPLRERDSDSILIAEHFFETRRGDGGEGLQGFTDEALKCIREHGWPGNVRELLNRLQRAMVMCDGSLITPEDLQLAVPSEIPTPRSLANARAGLEREIVEAALARNGWNASAAARDLGVSRVTLYRLRRRLGLINGNGEIWDEPEAAPSGAAAWGSIK